MSEQWNWTTRRRTLKSGMVAAGAIVTGGVTLTESAFAGIGNGRVADYHLNNIKPDGTVKDASTEHNHGRNHGAAIPTDGAIGKAAKFDGDADYISVPDDGSLDIEEALTISFWFKLAGESNDNPWPRAVSKGQSTTGNGAYGVFVKDTRDPEDIGLRFIDDGGTSYDIRDRNLPDYDDDLWHHVAATYSDNEDEGRLYVDHMAPVVEKIPGDVSIDTTDDKLHIGDGNNQRHFNGLIDEVRIYDRALSEEEIDELAEQAYAIAPFLYAHAEWNNEPWDGEITDKTGESEVDIDVGAITTINPMGGEDPGPFAFDPQAVEISPDTAIKWNWLDFGEETPHHSVTSYNGNAEDPSDPKTTGDHGTLFDEEGTGPHSFTYTFKEPGLYLYFCHPHGAPYPAYDHFLDDEGLDPIRENLFGMRGAILVEE